MFFLFESMAGKTMLTALHFHTEQTGCGVSESNLMLMAGLKNIFRYNRLIVIILTSILWVLIRKFKDNHHCLFLPNIGEIKLVGHPIFSLLKRVTSRGSLKYSVIPKFLPSLLSIVIVHLYLRVNQFTVGVRFIHSQSNFGRIQLFIGKSIINLPISEFFSKPSSLHINYHLQHVLLTVTIFRLRFQINHHLQFLLLSHR